jgi:ribosomal protein L17
MDGDIEMIPDLKYRVFMLKLSRQITEQDMKELKYVLTRLIPNGKKEKLNSALECFVYLNNKNLLEKINLAI